MQTQNKYINKDDYTLFRNNMTAFEESRDDKSVSTKLMKGVIIFLYIIFIIISILFFKRVINNNGVRIIVLVLYVCFIIGFYKYYIKIAYHIVKFIENNLLFKI